MSPPGSRDWLSRAPIGRRSTVSRLPSLLQHQHAVFAPAPLSCEPAPLVPAQHAGTSLARRHPLPARDPAQHRQRHPPVRQHRCAAAPRPAAGLRPRRPPVAPRRPRLPRVRARAGARFARRTRWRSIATAAAVRAEHPQQRPLRPAALRAKTTPSCSGRKHADCPMTCSRRSRHRNACACRCVRTIAASTCRTRWPWWCSRPGGNSDTPAAPDPSTAQKFLHCRVQYSGRVARRRGQCVSPVQASPFPRRSLSLP